MTDQPAKKLKLSFAMGGGVSLGAFSGAALTEVLKLLLVDGRDANKQRYSHIELDSMSGASAGAISLCIMLSSLLNYKRYLSEERDLPDNKFRLADIDNDLAQQFGVNWKNEHAAQVEPLRALQLSQKLQEKLWVEKVNMRELMRIHDFNPKEKDGFSLLNRNLLVELVNDFILTDVDQVTNGESHIITDSRFLFACSLTNLIPLPLGNIEKQDTPPPPLVRELRKAHASYNHKELRVFDFQLNPSKKQASKLLKAVPIGIDSDAPHHIAHTKTWSMIASTCLACGAFPFAFEPVALKRFVYEYVEPPAHNNTEEQTRTHTEQNRGDLLNTDFEPEMSSLENATVFQSDYKIKYNKKVRQFVESYTGRQPIEKEQPQENEDENITSNAELLFSYIDGGTLNNEPIREAFRLANYIDSRDPEPRESYDRIVMFVDPIVRTEPIGHNSNDYDKYKVSESHQRLQVKENTEINRLTAYAGKLIRTLRDQGSIKEEHKISTYLSTIKLNQKLADLIAHSPFEGDITIDFVETFYEFINYQDRSNNDEQISTFNVNDHTFIKYAVQRYIDKYNLVINRKKLLQSFYILRNEGVKIQQQLSDFNTACTFLNENIEQEYKPVLKKMLYDLLLQMILNTDGKDPSAMRMAITPVQYPVELKDNDVELKTIELPGEEFQAFGGFVNKPARAFSNEYGRYCAYKTLTAGDFRQYFHRIMHDEKPGFAQLIEKMPEWELAYRKKLINLSPLNQRKKANRYWSDVRQNIFNLMKIRVKKSANPLFSSTIFLGGIAAMLLVLFVPWYLERDLGWNGAISQFVLLAIALIIGYLLINSKLVSGLKASFYNHQIHSLKLALTFPDTMKCATHYRFNHTGKYNSLLRDDDQYVLPIPFYLKRDASLMETDIEGIELKLVPHQKIAKKFKHVFSTLALDVEEELESVQLYRRKFIFFWKQLDVHIDLQKLINERKLKVIEQHISPLVICHVDSSGQVEYNLIECAKPLEETIQSYHREQEVA